MKLNKLLPFILIVFTAMDFGYYEDYCAYTPVLMKRTDFENSVYSTNAKTLKNPGKIYAKDNYLFINEKYEGIHIIDNSDPENPENVGFINIPGSIDMAIKENIMYVDNAVDLVAISLTNFPDIIVAKRIKNIYPELLPPGYSYIPSKYMAANRPKNTVIVNWTKKGI